MISIDEKSIIKTVEVYLCAYRSIKFLYDNFIKRIIESKQKIQNLKKKVCAYARISTDSESQGIL